jgi:hypothetical protein
VWILEGLPTEISFDASGREIKARRSTAEFYSHAPADPDGCDASGAPFDALQAKPYKYCCVE